VARSRRLPSRADWLARSLGCQGLSTGASGGATDHHRSGVIQWSDGGRSRHCRVSGSDSNPQRSHLMVIRLPGSERRRAGLLMVELLVAMALITGALLPLAYSLASERRLVRATYQRAVAMEIVDGEMEVLAAGRLAAFAPGTR